MALYGVENNYNNFGVLINTVADQVFVDWHGGGRLAEIDYDGTQSPTLPLRLKAAGGSTQWPINATITELSIATLRNSVGHLISFAETSIVTLSKTWSSLKSIALTELSVVTVQDVVSKLISFAETTVVSLTKSFTQTMGIAVTEASNIILINEIGKIITLTETSTVMVAQALAKIMEIVVTEISNIIVGINYVINVLCGVVANTVIDVISTFIAITTERRRRIRAFKRKNLRMMKLAKLGKKIILERKIRRGFNVKRRRRI